MSANCKRWWVGALLFASLALNVFFGGWLFTGHPPLEPHGPMMFWDAFNDKLQGLPADERASVKKVLDAYRPKVKAQMKEIMQSRDAIDQMFASSDYNRAEAEKRFADMQEKSVAMQQLMHQMMLDVADALPPEHRANFMQRPKALSGKGEEFREKPAGKAAVKNAATSEEAPRTNEATRQ